MPLRSAVAASAAMPAVITTLPPAKVLRKRSFSAAIRLLLFSMFSLQLKAGLRIEESDEPACLRHTFVSYGESKWIMGWFRQKVPWLSRLALFALAVQIVLSFGHAHLGGVAPASAAGVNAPVVESNSAAAPGPALPIDRDRNSPAHDFCALCASISLLHSLVLPVPAALAALAEFDCIQFRYASATAVLAHPRSPSQARAPPFA